jgi:hypothetical protein
MSLALRRLGLPLENDIIVEEAASGYSLPALSISRAVVFALP